MNLVANARMYAVTPAVRAAWQSLFAWLATKSGVPLAYLEHAAPAPLEALWARDDLGAAFMCGFPYASAVPQPQILAAPVPSPARYGGLPRYCTDFVVLADHPAGRLSDTFGGRLGWTVEHSQSGYNAVRHHLLRYQADRDAPLFRRTVGPLLTPRRVIDAVLDGSIDVGPVDSYVHDLLEHHEPGIAARIRTIESTAMTPIPPLIASAAVSEEIAERLRDTLLSGVSDPTAAAAFSTLLVTRFVLVEPNSYDALLAQASEADRAGVAMSNVPDSDSSP